MRGKKPENAGTKFNYVDCHQVFFTKGSKSDQPIEHLKPPFLKYGTEIGSLHLWFEPHVFQLEHLNTHHKLEIELILIIIA